MTSKPAKPPRPRAGDLALIPNLSWGSPLRQIAAVETDEAGAITFYAIGANNVRVAADQVTAVFANILNPLE